MSYVKAFIAVAIIAAVGALTGAPTANAASDFDQLINPIDKLEIIDTSNQQVRDITYSWYSILEENNDQSQVEAFLYDLDQAIYEGSGWVVTQDSSADYPHTTVDIFVAQAPENKAYFSNQYGNALFLPTKHKLTIVLTDGTYSFYTNNAWTNREIVFNTDFAYSGNGIRQPLFINHPIDYPANYEGINAPLDAPAATEESQEVPEWYVSNSFDWKVDIHDTNFNTFDEIKWTCSEDGNSIIDGDEGLAPVLYWEIWDDNAAPDMLMNSGYHNATAQITWQAPKLETDKTYRIAGWYDCGGVDFISAGNKEFMIDSNGALGSNNLSEICFDSEDFPYLDINACNNALMTMLNNLHGGVIKMPDLSVAAECRNIPTLANWLNLNNPNVCPAVPERVRDVTTPLLGFILGLTTLTMLHSRLPGEF